MTDTTRDPASTTPRPIADRIEATALAHTAYQRFADATAALGPEDWGRATDCEGWTVRDLAGHVVGALRSAASMREMVSQQAAASRRARRDGGDLVDAMTAIQVERTAGLSPDEVVAELQRLVEPATNGRRRTPALLRKAKIRVQMGDLDERWSLGYVVDTILTRDAWLHRVDLARAVSAEPVLTADHDGRIVADVVAEWARRHGQPYHLVVTGPAGGTYRSAEGGAGEPGQAVDPITIDAIDLCRILSGRAAGEGLLATAVPF
jgi:uncharacterized protein (TIGR03083 family)